VTPMSIGLIGRKVGMTQVFQPDGTMVAVSVVELKPNTVTRLRTGDRDGYTAVQLGAGERKKLTKPLAGQLKDLPRVRYIREFRLDSVDDFNVGQQIAVGDIFANEPIYVGLASGLVVFLVGSLLSKPTASHVMAEWERRSRGEGTAPEPMTEATI